MPQDIEVILMRQLASCLAMPILVVDPQGDLVFFNEPAEAILGRRFEETGTLRRGEWSATFKPTDSEGVPLTRQDQPLFIATDQRRAVHGRGSIEGFDGVRREIEGAAFPLLAKSGQLLGAVSIFWEVKQT